MRNTIKLIFGVEGFLALGSCNKNLDQLPPTSLSTDLTFTSVADLERGLLGVYSGISGENNIAVNAVLSDELKVSDKNLGQWQFEFNYQFNSSTESFGFAGFYVNINRATRILAAAEGVTATTPAEEALKNQIIGELRAIRAYAHFELLQRYAPPYDPAAQGITNVDRIIVTEKSSRNTVAENITFIEADLTAARASSIPNAPVLDGTGLGNIRISKAFIAGVQARVALYKKDYPAAATFASDAITLSGKALATRAQFPEIWTDGDNTTVPITSETEVLLRLPRSGTGLGEFFSSTTNVVVYFEPSDKLKNQFDRSGADVRFPTYFTSDFGTGDTSLVKKYYESAQGPRVADVKLMRIAEMYLIRAEANARQNQLGPASNDINALRSNRISPYTNITYTDQATALNDILVERQKELCYEGFRLFDLKRFGLGVNRLASDVRSATWQTIGASDYRFVTLPIPQSQLQVNPGYGQNNGYQ